MPDADPLADLAIRRHQLETHLLQSHEYREKGARRLKLLMVIKLVTLVLVLAEGFAYIRQPKPASPILLGIIAATLIVLVASTFLLWRTWLSLSRLNERWLTPDAKRVLEALRMEQARSQAEAS